MSLSEVGYNALRTRLLGLRRQLEVLNSKVIGLETQVLAKTKFKSSLLQQLLKLQELEASSIRVRSARDQADLSRLNLNFVEAEERKRLDKLRRMDRNKVSIWQEKASRLLKDIAREEDEYTRLLLLKEETEVEAWRLRCQGESMKKLVDQAYRQLEQEDLAFLQAEQQHREKVAAQSNLYAGLSQELQALRQDVRFEQLRAKKGHRASSSRLVFSILRQNIIQTVRPIFQDLVDFGDQTLELRTGAQLIFSITVRSIASIKRRFLRAWHGKRLIPSHQAELQDAVRSIAEQKAKRHVIGCIKTRVIENIFIRERRQYSLRRQYYAIRQAIRRFQKMALCKMKSPSLRANFMHFRRFLFIGKATLRLKKTALELIKRRKESENLNELIEMNARGISEVQL